MNRVSLRARRSRRRPALAWLLALVLVGALTCTVLGFPATTGGHVAAQPPGRDAPASPGATSGRDAWSVMVGEPQAAIDRWFGIQIMRLDPTVVDQVQGVGAGWIRIPLIWSHIEPQNTTPDNYQWPAAFDGRIADLSARNIHTILTLKGNPTWAATYGSGPIDKTDIGELVEFMEAAVAHYGAPPYNVKYWEMYNEPDNYAKWRAESGGWGYFGNQPQAYVDVLRAVYGPMKAVDPQAQVVFGGVAHDNWGSGFDQQFVDGVLQGGGGSYFDVMNFHYFPAYAWVWDDYGTDIMGKANYLRDKLASHGVYKPSIVTETCMWADAAHSGSEELQSRYVVQVMSRGQAAGLDLAIWWWLHEDRWTSVKCDLIRLDGTPRPAYYAYQTLSEQMSSSRYVRTLDAAETGSAQIEAYQFVAGDGLTPIVVAWTVDDSTRSMPLEAAQIVVVDKYGGIGTVQDGDDGVVDGRVQVPVGPSPVYLRFEQGFALSVQIDGQGVVDKAPNRAIYQEGDVVTLTPRPDPGWRFDGWSGADAADLVDNGDGTWSLTMDAHKVVRANFGALAYTLSIGTAGQGSVTVEPDQPVYHYGDALTLTPSPALGWRFDGWGGANAGDPTDNGDGTWSLTIDGDKALTATFVEADYILAIATAGQGAVTRDPDQPTYRYGDAVTLTPVASSGWRFDGWSGPNAGDLTDNGNGTWSLTMDGDKALTANFREDGWFLTIGTVGGGMVQVEPAKPLYQEGEVVHLTPLPATGWRFYRWSGADAADLVDEGDGTWSLTMDGDKVLTAAFEQVDYSLTIGTSGQGTVVLDPDQAVYRYGQAVTLTPVPGTGWRFDTWTGPDAGELVDQGDGTWSLTIDGDKALTAVFAEADYTLAIETVGQGVVEVVPVQPTYRYGDRVTLTPVPDTDWTFDGWSGADAADPVDNGDGTWSLTMDGDKALTARFGNVAHYVTLTIIELVGEGQVAHTPGNPYIRGETAILEPQPEPGWSFGGWGGPDASGLVDNGDGTWSLLMDGDKTLAVTFTQDEYTLTVDTVGQGTVLRDPQQPAYHYGDVIILTPMPSVGWRFDGWSGADASDLVANGDASWSLTMDGDQALVARFVPFRVFLPFVGRSQP